MRPSLTNAGSLSPPHAEPEQREADDEQCSHGGSDRHPEHLAVQLALGAVEVAGAPVREHVSNRSRAPGGGCHKQQETA